MAERGRDPGVVPMTLLVSIPGLLASLNAGVAIPYSLDDCEPILDDAWEGLNVSGINVDCDLTLETTTELLMPCVRLVGDVPDGVYLALVDRWSAAVNHARRVRDQELARAFGRRPKS